jgi:hypothetical protein
MKIELRRNENLDGMVYFHVMVDGCSQRAFQESEEEKAREYYALLKERMGKGYPKSESILSEEI